MNRMKEAFERIDRVLQVGHLFLKILRVKRLYRLIRIFMRNKFLSCLECLLRNINRASTSS